MWPEGQWEAKKITLEGDIDNKVGWGWSSRLYERIGLRADSLKIIIQIIKIFNALKGGGVKIFNILTISPIGIQIIEGMERKKLYCKKFKNI